jgi:tetratricopeptide (TPR) repeat protein
MGSPSRENLPLVLVPPAVDHASEKAAVRRELECLLASPALRNSDQLRQFLRYIVERTLAGEGDLLKEYRLGVEVFDRDASFDPKIDPVVRMAARRLRAKLKEHYENGGLRAAVRIEVPKGGYAVSFVHAPAQERTPEQTVVIHSGRRWSLAALAVLVIAGLMGGGGLYYRAHHQMRRLSDRDTIVLADFANSTGDPVFDDTLKTALTISLQQSPFLNLLPDSEVKKTLQQMTRPASTKLTADVTRELCQRAGSKAYIAGAIASLGSDYVLGLKSVNCQTGDTLAQEQATAASKEKILDVLGKAASRLRGQMGESLATLQRFDVPLEDATTPSLEALKAYSLGRKADNERGHAGLPYDQRAIELDPGFAVAYEAVGNDYSNLGEQWRASEYFTKAFQLREHACEWEKLKIAADYYLDVTGELDKAGRTYQEQITSYPLRSAAYNNLGLVYALQGQYEKAAEYTRQNIRLTPVRAGSYGNLANYAIALQNFDETRHIIHDAQTRKMDHSVFHTILYALAFFANDSQQMTEQQQWLVGKADYEDWGLALASDTEAYDGRVGKARELIQHAVDSAIHADNKENGAIYLANAAVEEAAYGNVAEARRSAANALKLAPTSPGVESEAAIAFAMAGDTVSAESLAQDLGKRFPLHNQTQWLWLPAIRAQLDLDRKDPATAITALQAASPFELGQIAFVHNLSCLYPVYVRGEAYLAAGQGGAAAAEFQKIIDHNGIVWNCWTGALAHLGVARANALQAGSGQVGTAPLPIRPAQSPADADAARARALTAYRYFLTLWKDADPDIPVLKQAKAEYAKLQ